MSHPINLPYFLGKECLHYKSNHLVNPDTQEPWGRKTKCQHCEELTDEFRKEQEEMERKIRATNKPECESCELSRMLFSNPYYVCALCRPF